MDEKKCIVEFIPDPKLGWVIKPIDGCDEVFEKISQNQGPHAARYLDVRKVEVKKGSAEALQPSGEE
jgi:hypothetical protein